MPRITEDLVRRRAEHNEGEIASLEELSLHQQEIERIEHLDRWCRNLKILYLQNNLIPRIENVGRLKQLEYLNLALNNVERIENLQGCEFLNKLDLTVNFVGDLLSVESLQSNQHFRELYLTGNPCTDYEGYREFVVATLPQLQWLDGKEVSKSERILAKQNYREVREGIVEQQRAYQAKREREKREHREKEEKKERQKERTTQPGFDGRWYTDTNSHTHHKEKESTTKHQDEDEEEREFWNEPTAYTPESRTEVHQYMAEKRREEAKSSDGKGLHPHKREVKLERDGKMLNVNEGRYDFCLKEDEKNNQYLLEVAVPRYMDTTLIECDVQPTYVRLKIKGKVLQLVLDEEVSSDRSSAQRSQTSGSLLVTLPKAREVVRGTNSKPSSKNSTSTLLPNSLSSSSHHHHTPRVPISTPPQQRSSHHHTNSSATSVDFRNIVKRKEEEGEERGEGSVRETEASSSPLVMELNNDGGNGGRGKEIKCDSDDSDVPPLI